MKNFIELIEPVEYDKTVKLLRDFFSAHKGFVEVPVQHRLSILAACEDPRTIGTFNYAGFLWPLPQTGQMWLEYELLTKPNAPGYWCISTSYRNEPHPIPGRHNLIFPMFEFETHGSIEDLQKLEEELLEFLGFGQKQNYKTIEYREALKKYSVGELAVEHEEMLQKDLGPVVFLKNFPERTSPFWNMKRKAGYARKIDVILYGIETIGSAERSTSPDEMRALFYAISNGMYGDILLAQFGRERVEKELDEFFSLPIPMIERCGGGIGITRMIRALKSAGILSEAPLSQLAVVQDEVFR